MTFKFVDLCTYHGDKPDPLVLMRTAAVEPDRKPRKQKRPRNQRTVRAAHRHSGK